MTILRNYIVRENMMSAQLEEQLRFVKQEMYDLAMEFGLSHELTVAKSQELDLILNRIHRLRLLEQAERQKND